MFPEDEYNRKLVANVHPPDWVNPQPARRYNLVVIGAGTAGLVTAAGAAGLGAKVALIERHLLGGDCLNAGCVPSKALIRAARAYAAVRDAGEFGVNVPQGTSVDFSVVMQRMRRLRAEISRHDSAARFRELGVDVFLGSGAFTGPDTIEVGNSTLRFKKGAIASGARPAVLPIPGLEQTGCLTSETLFSLTELPRRLAVIGAGPLGCEMAQTFARFGSKVSLFESRPHILSREDRDAAGIVEAAMLRDGVELLTGSNILEVRQKNSSTTSSSQGGDRGGGILFEQDGEQQERTVDAILIGVGRRPNVEGLNLERAGVEFDQQHGVKVDDHLCTTNPHVYACGDVCFPYKFTHTADFQARIVIGNALFGLPFLKSKASRLTIPWCTYTDPEIAHVGLSQRDAAERGIPVQTFVQPLSEVDRAVLDGEDAGFVKVHVRKGSDKILGATIVAAHAGEMISEITLAMANGMGLKRIGNTIHPYPTQAEGIRKLGDLYNRTRLTPLVRFLLKRWFGWTR